MTKTINARQVSMSRYEKFLDDKMRSFFFVKNSQSKFKTDDGGALFYCLFYKSILNDKTTAKIILECSCEKLRLQIFFDDVFSFEKPYKYHGFLRVGKITTSFLRNFLKKFAFNARIPREQLEDFIDVIEEHNFKREMIKTIKNILS